MKELTIQEKAEAYDKAKEKIVLRFGSNVAEEIFSEFDESDDEKIISAIRKAIEAKVENLGNGVTRTACLAWLEMQGKCETVCHRSHQDANHPNGCIVLEDFNAGEGFYKVHLDYLSRKQVEVVEEMVRAWNNDSKTPDEDIKSCIGMCLTDADEQRFKDYNTSLKDCLAWLEMQGGQEEPQVYETEDGEIITYSETDGYKVVEPRFKVGDWVVRGDTIAQILDIQEQYYVGLDINGKDFTSSRFLNEDKIHLWSIKDAKKGDVLVHNGCTFIFMGIENGIVQAIEENLLDGETCNFGESDKDNDYSPATKEQRDLLFQKMKESGYEWNAEELRLDKVEPKFHEGDWIVSDTVHEDYYICKIIGVNIKDGSYTIESIHGYKGYNKFDVFDKTYRLWTISDARDGDVLADEDNNIGIYQGKVDDVDWHSCIYLGCNNYLYDVGYHIIKNTKPATKEQRDLLFKKMKEAGYEWNAEELRLDKAEPKFHEGDWTVSKLDGKARQISEVHFDEYNSYYVVDGKDVNLEEYDRLHHLWTIKDVKDGDVLQLGGVTAIFKEYIGYGNCKCYCSVFDGEFEIPSQDGDDNSYGCIDAAPATKEQRDKLEKAMADAGYTFDFEKKELKKTEQTPAWSEEDEKRLAELSSILEIGGNFAISDWLKSLKQRIGG